MHKPYLISFLGHAFFLAVLSLLAVRSLPPLPMASPMVVELVKLAAPPPTPVAPSQPQPVVAEPIPRIQPRVTTPSPVDVIVEPLPVPAQAAAAAATNTQPQTDTALDPGRPLSRTPPDYPDLAQRRGIEGTVELRFTIKEDGSVSDIRVASSQPAGLFDESALRSQRTARYEPYKRNGVPIDQPNCRAIFRFKMPN